MATLKIVEILIRKHKSMDECIELKIKTKVTYRMITIQLKNVYKSESNLKLYIIIT